MGAGFVRGRANPCLFRNDADDVSLLVHGDDFCAVGPPRSLEKVRQTLSVNYKVNTELLGSDDGDLREVRVLNRVVQIGVVGVRLEADARHAELVVREFGLEGGRDVASPGDKDFFKKDLDAEEMQELSKDAATRYWATVARLNYMASEHPDLQYSVKELARSMSAPRVSEQAWGIPNDWGTTL